MSLCADVGHQIPSTNHRHESEYAGFSPHRLNNQLPDNDTLVPMFWFRQEVRISEDYARLARFALNLRDGMPYGFYALTVRPSHHVLVCSRVSLFSKHFRSNYQNYLSLKALKIL